MELFRKASQPGGGGLTNPAPPLPPHSATTQMRHLFPAEIESALNNTFVQEFIAVGYRLRLCPYHTSTSPVQIPPDHLYLQAKLLIDKLYSAPAFNREAVDFLWENLWELRWEPVLKLADGGRAYGVFEIPTRLQPVKQDDGTMAYIGYRHFRLRFDRELLVEGALLRRFGEQAFHVYRYQ